MIVTPSLSSVQLGRIAPLGPAGVPSAFVKHPVDGPVAVGRLGLAGDEQADLTVHGGAEKAVYAYGASHYPAWVADFPFSITSLQLITQPSGLVLPSIVTTNFTSGSLLRTASSLATCSSFSAIT